MLIECFWDPFSKGLVLIGLVCVGLTVAVESDRVFIGFRVILA